MRFAPAFVESSESADERLRMIYKVKKEVSLDRMQIYTFHVRLNMLIMDTRRLSKSPLGSIGFLLCTFFLSHLRQWLRLQQNCITYCLTKSTDTETHTEQRVESLSRAQQKSRIIKLFSFSSNSPLFNSIFFFLFFSNLSRRKQTSEYNDGDSQLKKNLVERLCYVARRESIVWPEHTVHSIYSGETVCLSTYNNRVSLLNLNCMFRTKFLSIDHLAVQKIRARHTRVSRCWSWKAKRGKSREKVRQNVNSATSRRRLNDSLCCCAACLLRSRWGEKKAKVVKLRWLNSRHIDIYKVSYAIWSSLSCLKVSGYSLQNLKHFFSEFSAHSDSHSPRRTFCSWERERRDSFVDAESIHAYQKIALRKIVIWKGGKRLWV